jgi:hypothetical protein
MSCGRLGIGFVTLGGLLLLPRHAPAAENADACADAYELTQSEERSGRLFAARKDARVCAAKCPARLASDCNAWETRITAQIPSFVVQARGADGAPVAVNVELDGAPATLMETGSIEAEPGPHRLVLIHLGVRVEAHVDLVAGVRNQVVRVTVADTAPTIPLSSPGTVGDTPKPRGVASAADDHSIHFWRWLVGGLGLATVAVGGAVSISGEVLNIHGPNGCAPHCSNAQADEVVARWIIGDTIMGVGGAMVLTTLLWPARRLAIPGQGPAARVSLGPAKMRLEVTF